MEIFWPEKSLIEQESKLNSIWDRAKPTKICDHKVYNM